MPTFAGRDDLVVRDVGIIFRDALSVLAQLHRVGFKRVHRKALAFEQERPITRADPLLVRLSSSVFFHNHSDESFSERPDFEPFRNERRRTWTRRHCHARQILGMNGLGPTDFGFSRRDQWRRFGVELATNGNGVGAAVVSAIGVFNGVAVASTGSACGAITVDAVALVAGVGCAEAEAVFRGGAMREISRINFISAKPPTSTTIPITTGSSDVRFFGARTTVGDGFGAGLSCK